jgi:hypothetical protein
MNIRIQYQPTAKELAKASILFLEKKPFILVLVTLTNIIVGFVVISLVFLLILQHALALNQWIALSVGLTWLLGRKRMHEWMLFQRMKRSNVLDKEITIEISRNGISWSGKGLVQGNMKWEYVKYILEAKNGFIMPNTFTRFLWLPFRGFASPEYIEEFRALIIEKKVVYKKFPKWQC